MIIKKATLEDLEEILNLQKTAYISEAQLYNDFSIPPLTQTLENINEEFSSKLFLKACTSGKIIGSVRAFEKDGTCFIGRLIVHPDMQNKGIGKQLMKAIEEYFNHCKMYELFTGKTSIKNLCFYEKLGYKAFKEEMVNDNLTFVYLQKENLCKENEIK